MSLATKIIVLVYIVLNYSYSVTSEVLVPCVSDDTNCLIKLLGNVRKSIDPHPLEIRDVIVNIEDVLEFNITESVLSGLDTCEYVDVRINLENGSAFVIVQCNLVSRGIYNAIIWKPKSIGVNVNNYLNGDGPYELSLLNIRIKYNVKVSVIKSDGDFYLQFDGGSVEYSVNNEGHKVVYVLSGVYSGTEDVTVTFNKALNKNWKPASTMVVGDVLKSIIRTIAEPKLKYLSQMPLGNFLTDDVKKIAIEGNDKGKSNKKCSIKDAECQLELIRDIKASVSKGVPELDIPKLDVLVLKNLTVQLPDLMDFNLLEGSINGVDKCILKAAKFDMDSKKFTLEQLCDLTIKGIYVASLYANATMSTFGGRNVDAHGNTEVTLVKLPLNAVYELMLNKKENGDTYFNFNDIKINYDFNEPGHSLSFKLDGVQLGSLDISEIAMNILNDNWQFFAPDFGPTFILAITKLINEPLIKYLANIPTKQYFVESLSRFV